MAATCAAVLAAAAVLGSCNYLYPGHSFGKDTEFERRWSAGDTSAQEMPQSVESGMGIDDDWGALFPGADDRF
jgi:hypothetical protein